MLSHGAEVVDIGAESTRPGAMPIDAEEEWKRLGAVLKAARDKFPIATISVDTRHGATAEKALQLGADWINDVTAGSDPRLLKAVSRQRNCRYVFMHSLSIPADPKQVLPEGLDIVTFMHSWARDKTAQFRAAGLDDEQLIFDPGIGFGKTAQQSWDLVRRAAYLVHEVECAVLFGHSRKSFLKTVMGDSNPDARDLETHLLSAHLEAAGVAYLRVHDVQGTRRSLALANALESGF